MSLRAAETIYIQVGIPRKKKLKRACRLAKLSQAKVVNAAIDQELERLSEQYPQLAERNGAKAGK